MISLPAVMWVSFSPSGVVACPVYVSPFQSQLRPQQVGVLSVLIPHVCSPPAVMWVSLSLGVWVGVGVGLFGGLGRVVGLCCFVPCSGEVDGHLGAGGGGVLFGFGCVGGDVGVGEAFGLLL